MRSSRRTFVASLAVLTVACRKRSSANGPTNALRIVSIGSGVTETVYALDCGNLIVGLDTSSVFPAATEALPKVGYQRTIAAEGVLGLGPTIVLATAEAGPPPALDQIKAAGVRVETIETPTSVEGTLARIRRIAQLLDLAEKGEELATRVAREVETARAKFATVENRPRVLAIYARGPSQMLVFGKKTAADAMLSLVGADNAITEFESSKPLTPESVIAAAPDAIVLPSRGLESLGGIDKLLATPGIADTPAGKAKRIVPFDDLLLLSFGPRLGQAIAELGRKLHPELAAGGS